MREVSRKKKKKIDVSLFRALIPCKSLISNDIDSCSALPKCGKGYYVFIIEFMR